MKWSRGKYPTKSARQGFHYSSDFVIACIATFLYSSSSHDGAMAWTAPTNIMIPRPTTTTIASSTIPKSTRTLWNDSHGKNEGICRTWPLFARNEWVRDDGGQSGNVYSALEKVVLSSSENDSRSLVDRTSGTGIETVSGGSLGDNWKLFVEQVSSLTSQSQTSVKGIAESIHHVQHSVLTFVIGNILSVLNALDQFTSFVFSAFVALPLVTLEDKVSASLQYLQGVVSAVDLALLQDPTVGPVVSSLQLQMQQLAILLPGGQSSSLETVIPSVSPSLAIVLSAITTYSIVSTVLSFGKGPPPSSPYPLGRYDPNSARAYFDQRPLSILQRGLDIALLSAGFGLKLLKDKVNNQLEQNQDQRALELAELLTKLGPTFIKIGQSLSIRTDLLSPAYVRGLTSLQDQVPPFSTADAREIIEDELGQSVDSLFSEFSSEPVAAASLGQVFRARLKSDGREVAVKVQRPNIMNQIALDMHLLREVAPVVKRTFNLNSDTVGTVDAWGLGFVDELNYISEAENAEYFTESIQNTPLKGVVFAPAVIEDCTTGKVLTTEWVIGERLDKSSSQDITTLCSIAMNTYLTMMLETGVLHCDPHPGNLLRTPDGKLCILDWGMVTRIDPDLQITLIEHMAHLTSADYGEVPRDLLLLGFIPESKADLISDSGIVEVLANVYGQWTAGGGVNGINVNEVVASLQDLTVKKGNLFQIPPYFAYIAKSFSVLEGIGLSNNPKYSIINECLPYVSKRLLTDRSERTGGALSTFIFGPTKNNSDRIIDYKRVEQLISGFGDYSVSASGTSFESEESRIQAIDNIADQVLELLASEEETPLQSIFIEQIANIISASSRSVWFDLRERSGKLPNGRTVLGTLVDPFGLFRTSPVVRLNSLDKETIESTRNLIILLGRQSDEKNNIMGNVSALSGTDIQQLASKLVQKVWARRNGIVMTGNRLATKLLQITADKLESGDRDKLFLPTSKVSKGEVSKIGTERRQTHDTNMPLHNSSERILTAKRLLNEVEREEALTN